MLTIEYRCNEFQARKKSHFLLAKEEKMEAFGTA